LDIAAALALCVRARTAAAVTASDLIEGVVDLAWSEGLAGLYVLAAFPPVRVSAIEDFLGAGLGDAVLWLRVADLFI
jgi:hypothetical protein